MKIVHQTGDSRARASVFAADGTLRRGWSKLVLGVAAMAALATASPGSCFAVEALAHLAGEKRVVTNGARKAGTSDFEVYAVGDNAKKIRQAENAESDHIKTVGKPSEDLAPPPSKQGKDTKIRFKNHVYGPTIMAVRDAPKLIAMNGWQEEWVRSFSGEATATAKYLPLAGPSVEAKAQVDRMVNPAAFGQAAARASDPIPIAPGDYPYRPTIRAMMQRDFDYDFATVAFGAGDGDGLLWAVSITAGGPLGQSRPGGRRPCDQRRALGRPGGPRRSSSGCRRDRARGESGAHGHEWRS